ncbi:hypothetical protein BsWGS_05959 [Bradybaena similaris]
MAETGGFSTINKIVAFVVSFMYRLTVKLAVEFLKFFILLAILLATFGVFGLAYVSFVAWVYVSYNSLPAAICAVFVGAVLCVITAVAVQYVVKDMLCLTDLSLPQLVMIYVKALTRRKPRPGKEDVSKDSQQSEHGVAHDEDVQQAKKKL